MARWLAKLQTLDRRWLYLAAALLLPIPLIVPLPVPPAAAGPTTRGLYQTIEACPADKVVLIDSSWDAGSAAENEVQLACVVRHLVQRRIRFVVTSIGVTQFGPEFAAGIIEPIAREAGYEYGRDWVNAGFVPGATGGLGVVIDGLCRDLHTTYPRDAKGTAVADLPLMQHVRSIADVHLVYCITYAPATEWISFVNGQFRTPVAFGCMSIMAPTYFPFWDSHQLCGMLIGNSGAGQYEALIHHLGRGSQLALVGSFANLIVIAVAVLGNIGWWAARRAQS
jgi:hypothetical protein